MKKIKTFLITILFTFIFYGNAVAATGAATKYKITIYKIELCDSSRTDYGCNNAVTIFEGLYGTVRCCFILEVFDNFCYFVWCACQHGHFVFICDTFTGMKSRAVI